MPRLILLQLTLVNFKSYAGEHVLGPFKPSFSCILGANGSGKSNVIDSLLFVFGWRAKALRHSRLADLIHTSAEHPALDYAKVNVHFALWDDSMNDVVAGSEFVVSRVVRRRNSDSYYEINSLRATQADIIAFMHERGMDLSSHRFLILQGEVERISLMKSRNAESLLDLQTETCLKHFREKLDGQPNLDNISVGGENGLLEFIENIVGTQNYVPVIARLTAELQLLEEVRSQSRIRLRTAASYRDELEERHAATVDSLKSLVDGAKSCARYSQVQIFTLRKTIATQRAEQLHLQRQCDELTQGKLEPVNQEITVLEREIEHATKSLAELTELLEKGCIERARELEVEKKIGSEKLEFYSSELNRCNTDITTQEAIIQQCQTKIAEFPMIEQKMKLQIAELEQLIANLSSQCTKTDGSMIGQKKLVDELESISQSIMPLRKQLISVTARLTAIRQSALTTANALGDLCCNIMAWIFLTCSSLKSLEEQLDAYIDSLHVLEEFEARLVEYRQTQDSSRTLHSEKLHIQSTIMEIETRLKALDSSQDLVKEQTTTERILMDAQAKGLLKGIYGRVGNLASVNSQDVNLAAISAFGHSLNTIVVDSMENIERALQFLREKSRGVTNFIDLSRVSEQYRKYVAGASQAHAPQGTVLFLDQLHMQNELFRPALWHVVRDTLLCNDINLANKLTSKRGATQRVVTYDGDVFDPSGIITGGGDKLRILQGGMGFVLVANASKSHHKDGARNEAHKEKLRQELNGELSTLHAKLAEVDAKLESCRQLLEQDQFVEQDATRSTIRARINGFHDNFAEAKDLILRSLSALRSSFASSVLTKLSIQVSSSIKKEVSELYHALSSCDALVGVDVVNTVRNLVTFCPVLMEISNTILTEFPETSNILLDILSSTQGKHTQGNLLASTFLSTLFIRVSQGSNTSDSDIVCALDQCADTFSTQAIPSQIFLFQTDIRQTILLGEQEIQLKSEEERLSREIQTLEALSLKVQEQRTDTKQLEIHKELNENSEQLKRLTAALQEATADHRKLEPRIARAYKQIAELHSAKIRLQEDLDGQSHQLHEIEQRITHINTEEKPRLRKEIAATNDRIKETNNQLSYATTQREGVLRELRELEQCIQTTGQAIQSKDADCRRHAAKYVEHLCLLDKLSDALELTIFDFAKLNINLNGQSIEVLTNQENMKIIKELCTFPQREIDSPEVADMVLELYGATKVDKKFLKSLDTGLNLDASVALLLEYRSRAQAVFERQAEFQAISSQYEEKKNELNEKRDQRASEFVSAFSMINTYLRDIYKTLTLGGDAQLEFINQFDPFDGILFSVMPPRKSWKQICNLSGGEKTLSSLSLIFALHCFKPTPLYVMDEIDAALDMRNVSIIANYIKSRTKNAQFVVISLRNNTFELADRLVGIYKHQNCSRCIICDPSAVLTKIQNIKQPPGGSLSPAT